jgi:hypothetical protein
VKRKCINNKDKKGADCKFITRKTLLIAYKNGEKRIRIKGTKKVAGDDDENNLFKIV